MRRRASRFGLDIILVNIWEGAGAREEAERFRELWGIEGPVLIDEHADLARRLGVRGVPTNVFVDADGTITAFGASTPESIRAELARLLPGVDLDEPPDGAGRDHWEQEPDHIERHVTAHNRP